MRVATTVHVTPEVYADLFQNHKKFIALDEHEVSEPPAIGDVLKFMRSNITGEFYRVVTLVEKVGRSYATGEGYDEYLLSIRPLGKAEKEEMRTEAAK